MSYAASLYQQSKWIKEALDPATPDHQRIGLDDLDTEEIELAADHLTIMEEALTAIAAMPDEDNEWDGCDKFRALRAVAQNALANR